MTRFDKNKNVPIDIDVFYPTVNQQSFSADTDQDTPYMKVVSMNAHGVNLISLLHLKENDFVSFLMKLGPSPSFPCLTVVNKVVYKENFSIAKCGFLLLKDFHQDIINKYIAEHRHKK